MAPLIVAAGRTNAAMPSEPRPNNWKQPVVSAQRHRGSRRDAALSPFAELRRGTSWRFWILCAFLLLCALGGGSSRAATLSLLYLRPAAVLCIAAAALVPGPWDFARYRAPLLILAALAAAIALQLVPLPPQWFAALPGHEKFTEASRLAGESAGWHSISLAPDLTLNSLLALLPALAVLVVFAGMNEADRDRTLLFLPVLALATILFAILQLAQGPDSPAYLYSITSRSLPVGLFANRNHQAAALAIAIPAFAGVAVILTRHFSRPAIIFGMCGVLSLLCILFGLLTGSRSGLALLGVGVLGTAAVIWPVVTSRRYRLLMVVGLGVALALAIVLAIAFGRATSVERLTGESNMSGELRLLTLPVLSQLVRDYMPFGSGFGTFDPIFRNAEPMSLLRQSFFNNAHNDFIELAITGGVAAVAVLIAAMLWFFHRGWHTARSAGSTSTPVVMAKLGWLALAMIALASLSDYPVRTPIFTAVAALMAAWLCSPVIARESVRA